jgi:hypothetical protein
MTRRPVTRPVIRPAARRLAPLPILAALIALLAPPALAARPKPLPITAEVCRERPVRYRPDGGDFVIVNGGRRFNRALYGIHGAGRVEAGDLPEFSFYFPGKGGTLKLGAITERGEKWLTAAERIEARYRPGAMLYAIQDPILGDGRTLEVVVLARADADGLVMRVGIDEGPQAGDGSPVELVWAYGAVNGERFSRGGDIGAEPETVFDLNPNQTTGHDFAIDGESFTLKTARLRMTGAFPAGAALKVASADALDTPRGLLASEPADRRVLAGRVSLASLEPHYLTIEHAEEGPRRRAEAVQGLFEEAVAAAEALRARVTIDTPDPYMNTLGAAIAVAADGVWDPPTYVHGAVAWPARLNGWRGAYAADALGWHDRARDHIRKYATLQITEPLDGPIEPDPAMNLARQTKNAGARLYSSGYISSWESKRRNHYDMNLVYIDMVFRHLMWTGDKDLARELWPVITRHLAWEKRCFDANDDGLYDAFACIWASDALQYTGGDVTHSSAYNYFHNHMAARVAGWIGEDPTPYEKEAAKIKAALDAQLWMDDEGCYAEYRDNAGRLHPAAALWTFYHTIDSRVPDAGRARRMSEYVDTHLAHIPIHDPDDPSVVYPVLPTTNWHPYEWSINNVAMAENVHAALAYWRTGRADKAFAVWKGNVLDNLYYGASPGNFQQLSHLDAYRGELYRDFADTIGISARAIVEGLFGVVPDAIAGEVTLTPGFPADWEHAKLETPNLSYSFKREAKADHYAIELKNLVPLKLNAVMPERAESLESVVVNGAAVEAIRNEAIADHPRYTFTAPPAERHSITLIWSGETTAPAPATPFDAFTKNLPAQTGSGIGDWDFKAPADAKWDTVDLSAAFNDRVTAIFEKGKYLSPRPNVVTLQIPTQGIGDWPSFNRIAEIDDAGLRRAAGDAGTIESPQGIPLKTPGAAGANNILFTSRWDNYPREATIPLGGRASHAYLLMAGSTNPMQSRIDNGEAIANYTDGTHSRLALRNPENWWSIEQNLFEDDYAFRIGSPYPPRLHLAEGRFVPAADNLGRDIRGGAATLLDLPLDPNKDLASLTVRTLSNEVVIGLMSLTLQR